MIGIRRLLCLDIRLKYSLPSQIVGRQQFRVAHHSARLDKSDRLFGRVRSNPSVIGLLGLGLAGATFVGFAVLGNGQHAGAEGESTANPGGRDTNDKREEHKEKKKNKKALKKVINEARDIMERLKDEVGSPGLVVAVTVDGKTVWTEGLGYADVENRVPCNPDTIMRIASISKPITMAIIAKLWEADQLDIDKPVTEYVKTWPEKEVQGKKVTITTRQLVSHLGGVRHYTACKSDKKEETDKEKKETKTEINTAKKDKETKTEDTTGSCKSPKDSLNEKNKKKKGSQSEFDLDEYQIRHHYESVDKTLSIFKDDCLCSKPGTTYLYTTHGWTLISAVAEGASGHKFPVLLRGLFKDLGLTNTYLDENEPIIYHRARFYHKNDKGRLVNVPYVDCSYKWAGGGLLSTVQDLVGFGNAMLYSYQQPSDGGVVTDSADSADMNGFPSDAVRTKGTLPGYLRPETVKAMWVPAENTEKKKGDGGYGMGWAVIPEEIKHGACRKQRFYVTHSGGAIGASSALLVLPRNPEKMKKGLGCPQGVVVSAFVNLQSVSLTKAALKIAEMFEEIEL